MKILKWGALLSVGAFGFSTLMLSAILNPIQIQTVQSANEMTNLADELVPIIREQGERWGFDWTLWAAYWGQQRWQLPVRSRLERLHEAREHNREQLARCQWEETPEAREHCRQAIALKPTDRSTIEREWEANARAYLEERLHALLGVLPVTTETLEAALQARMTPGAWSDVQALHEAYGGVVELQEDDPEGWVHLTQGEDYALYLRALDWEYLFPVQGAYEPFSDSWGAIRGQYDRVGANDRHHGTDIMAARGTPLVAVTDGEVDAAEWDFLGGWTVTLLGDDGLRYYYAHMAGPAHVRAGQRVHRGEILGEVGDSGEGPEGTTGKMPPHLHFGIYTSNKGTATNPYRYLLRWAGVEDKHDHEIMPVDPPPGWLPIAGFAWPADGPLTSRFGLRTSPIDGQRRLHSGIDLGVVYGSPIRASKAGIIAAAEWSDVYGWYVLIDHGDGYRTLYAHNSRLEVRAGDRVEQGRLLALAGSTGWSTGPHLHFEVHYEGAPIDPLLLLPSKLNRS